MRIDHIQLAMPVGHEDKARAFFVDVVGMFEEPKPESLQARGGCWFRQGACSVHLGVEDDFRPQRKAHPAFAVSDLQRLARTLTSAGHDVLWDDAIPGVSRFYTSDPFGNRLEFLCPVEGTSHAGPDAG
ncbi:MAG: glyoxalase [Gemmatimonadota bacterium]|jgi:catechol 2,3-dioxygenase-like lactoylglutathione lyase family enzyme